MNSAEREWYENLTDEEELKLIRIYNHIERNPKNRNFTYNDVYNSIIHNQQLALEYYLSSGIYIDRVFRDDTLLETAIKNSTRDIVKLLIDNKENVNLRRFDNGFSPLHIACIENRYDIVELLIESSANINAVNCLVETPLHISVRWNCEEIVMLLLNHYCDEEIKNFEGMTALSIAKYMNLENIIKIFNCTKDAEMEDFNVEHLSNSIQYMQM